MAKRVFFSFHYADVFGANVVSKHWLTKPDRESAGFFDGSLTEKAKTIGEDKVKALINDGLKYTSNTCVLIGSDTYQRPWVKYEIFKSLDVGNHLLGVHINEIIQNKIKGSNLFFWLGIRNEGNGYMPTEFDGSIWRTFKHFTKINFNHGQSIFWQNHNYRLSDFFSCYNWISYHCYSNFQNWLR